MNLPPLSPPEKPWELIDHNLRIFGALHEWKWERTAVEERRWDPGLAASAFSALRLAEMICLYRFLLAPRRGIAQSQINDIGAMSATALGFLAGHGEEAIRLARLQLAAYRRGYLQSTIFRPIAAFIARLFADYLGEEPVIFKGDPQYLQKGQLPADPVMDDLFRIWRSADAAVLAPRCVAACDIHTHQAIFSTKDRRVEFGSGVLTRTPIAVLVVFKLRRLLGLENPNIDHPLMDSVLGHPPNEPAGSEPHEILRRVHARMKQHGFDEREILAGFQLA